MEEEARTILRAVLAEEAPVRPHLVDAVRNRFATLGGVDLPESPRETLRAPPRFDR